MIRIGKFSDFETLVSGVSIFIASARRLVLVGRPGLMATPGNT